jgi:hypothetical protein
VDLPFDTSTLPVPAQKILDPKGPPPLRQMAAKGIAPGLKPNDALTVLVLLSEGEDDAIATAARATLDKLPMPLLNGAMAAGLPGAVIDVLAPRFAKNATVMEKMVALAGILPETVRKIATQASEPVCELLATNEERLLANPAIIEALYMNESTRMSTADRILELAVRNGLELKGIPAYKEAAAAIANELVAAPSPEPTPDDIVYRETDQIAQETSIDLTKEDSHKVDETTGEEIVEEKLVPLHVQLGKLTPSQKIRRALLGTPAERALLVRDTNRLVAQAAARSPSLQENEVVRITASRNVSEDVLRIIALDREWTRSHQIKLNLVQNPRTPFAFAAKLIPHLREHELKSLAKSKNVTGAVVTAARQQLDRRATKH